ARTTLLDPAKRKAYDARLLPQTAAPAVPIACPVPPVNSALPGVDVSAGEVFANLAGPPSAAGSAAAMRPTPDEPGHRALGFWVAGGVLLTAVVIAGIAVFLFGNKPDALKGKPGDADPGRVETKPKDPRPALTLTALPTEVVVAPGKSRTFDLQVERKNLTGPLQTDLRGLPKGVAVRAIRGGGDADGSTWEVSAGPEARAGETTVTVVVQVGPASPAGQFRLTVLPQPVVVRPDFGFHNPFVQGRWKLDGDELVQEEDAVATVFFGDPQWADYTITVEAMKERGPDGFGIAFRAARSDDCLWFTLGGWNNSRHAV